MTKKQSQPETALAGAVVKWLMDQKWDVYQEVQMHTYGPVADIVAIQGNIVWIVECKNSMSLAVMEQAYRWRSYANFISIAVPQRKNSRGSFLTEQILRKFGIGYLMRHKETNYHHDDITEMIEPTLNRKAMTKDIMNILTEKHKTFALAGNSEGKRWTPFQQTCSNILREVTKCPGITLKELISKITTHYGSTATARICIAKWADEGAINGVCVKRNGRLIKLYPIEKTELSGDKNNLQLSNQNNA